MKDMNNTANQAPAEKSKAKWIVLAAVLLLIAAIAVACSFLLPEGEEGGEDWLTSQLEDSGVTTIALEGDYYLEDPVQIRGEKIIEGEGTIFFAGEAEEILNWKDYQIPEDECYLLGVPELEERVAMFTMEKGSSLTIGEKVAVNAQNKVLTVNVPAGATLIIRDDALITGGLGANIINQGTVSVEGGTVLADTYFGIMNYANLSVTGGTLESNAKNMASVVSSSETVISGGAMKAKNSTNIYVTDGKLSVTGGALETAAFDNIYVAKGTAEITGGTITGGHGVHNAGGNVNVTGGQWLSSSHAIYNEGDMTVTGVTIEKTLNHAVVNRGEKAKLVAKNVTIGTATVHGIYNIRGAHMEVENLTVENAMGKGIHNGGAFFTGKNITIDRTMGAGVGNEREKGWQQDGTLTIQGLTVKKAGSKNIVCTAGEVNVSDATLGSIQSNSVQVSGGIVNLKDVEISGTVGSGALHGIYMTGGEVNAEDVTIGSTVGRGIQNRGAEFTGKNITIKDSRATGIGNQLSTDGTKNGTITIDGLEMSGGRGYYIHNVDGGTIDIKNGNVTIANNTGLRVDNGTVKLTNFTMTGEESDVTYNGFTINGGKLDLENVTLKNMTGRGINNMGGTVTGSDVTVLNNKATAIYNEGGKTQLSQVSTSGIKGYNVDVKGGSLQLTDANLGKSGSTSINVDAGANVILNNVVVNGTQKGHAVYVHKNSKLTFENLSISNAAARALSNGNTSSKVEGGTIVGTGLTITKPTATAIGNDSGTMKLKNVKVTDCTANTVNVKSGAVTIDGGELCKTGGTNVVLGGGELNLKGVSVQGTAKDNGITATAGKLTVNNVTITGAAGRGINNIGATITGTGLTVTKAGASAIYNEGTVDLKNVSLSESTGYNIDAKKGTVKITDGKLAITPVTNVNVSAGAAAELVNTQVLGTTSGHAVYVQKDAKLTFEKLSISNAAARALSNGNTSSNVEGGTIVGTDLTITKSAATAIGNDSGTMELKNVKVIDCTANTVNVKSGAVTIDGGELCKTASTNVVLSGGELNLKGVSVQGTAKDNGITATAGKLTVDNVTITGAAGRGINNIGATVTGTGLTVTKAGASAIYNEGTVELKNVSLSESTGYNVDAKKGTVKITDGKLAITPVSNVSVSAEATVELVNTQVLGTTSGHAVTALENAVLVLNQVSIADSAAQALNNRGGKITGSMVTISNAGATAIANESGTMDISGVEVTGSTGYNLDVKTGSVKLTKGAHTGILASTNVANVNVAAAETAELTLDGITVQGSATKGAIVVGNNAKAVFKDVTVNGEGGLTNGYAISAGNNSKVDLTNVKINGTTNQNAVYVATGAQVKIAGLTVTGGKKNALTNNGGVITGSGLNVSGCGAVAVYNAKGDMTLTDVNVTGGAGHSVNVDAGKVELTNATLTNATLNIKGGTTNLTGSTITGITADKTHGINMTGGTVTLHNVTVTKVSGAEARGIYQSAGTLTLTGTTTLGDCKLIGFQPAGGTTYINGTVTVTDTPNSINVGGSGQVHISENGKLVSNVGVYLPKNGYLTMDAATIGNTADEPLQIRSSNMSNGSVLVKAGSAEAAQNVLSSVKLLSENLFIKVSGTDVVVTNQQTVSVGDWEALVAAVESAQAGKPKAIVLTQSIDQPVDGGSITVKDGKIVTITDGGKDYTITRSATGALFQTGYDGTLIFDGSLTIANTNTSGTALANNGNMTLNNTKLDFSAAYNIISMNGDNAAQTGGHDLILKNVTMTNVTLTIKGGTVEADGLTISGISTDSVHGINMTGGTVTLKGDVSISNTTGKDARGIYQAGGTLTVAEDAVVTLSNNKLVGGHFSSGTTYINGTIIDTNTANAVNCGASNVHLGAKGKIVSNIGVYLPKNGYLTMDAATVGNTAEEPLKIRSSNITSGSVLVKASSAEAANNALGCVKLLSEDLFTRVSGTDVIATDQLGTPVADWASLKAAIEGAEDGATLQFTLSQNITQPADGGSIIVNNGKNVTITDDGKGYTITRSATGAALFATESGGILTINGKVTVNGGTGSVMELVSAGNLNLSGVTLENVSLKITGGKANVTNTTVTGISTDSKHGINMVGGELTLQGNVTISDTTGSDARGIYQAGGTLTVAEGAVVTLSNNKLVGGHFSSGTTYINGTIIDTNTANAVNCGASNVHLGAKGKIVSDIGVYLPKNGYLTMDAATVGNTASEPLKIRSSNITSGSVLVKASSPEAAQNVLSSVKLLNENLFIKVSGTDIVATNQPTDQPEVTGLDWASLKAAIEGAEDGATLQFTLSQNITQPADGGSIIVNNGKNVTITDDGKGYTITRSATGAALFATESGGTLTINGKVTVNGGTGSVMELVSAGNLNLSGVTLENVSLKVTGGNANVTNTTVTGIATDKKHGINMTGGTVMLHNVTVTNISGAEARGIYQSAGTLTLTGTTTLSSCKLIGFQPAGGTTYIRGTILDTNTANSINVGAGATVYLNADAKIISNIGIYLPSSGKLQLEQGVTNIGNSASEPLKIRHNNMTASGFVVLKTDSAEAAGNIAPCVVILNGTTTNLHASYQVAVSGNDVITNKVS